VKLSPAHVRAVERGAKTQHRVLITDPREVRRPGPRGKGGARIIRTGVSATYTSSPFRPVAGDSLVVQAEHRDENPARDKPEVRVLVTKVTTQTLADVTLDDALAEGHKTLADFADNWMRHHTPNAWPPKTEALCKQCDGTERYVNHDGDEQHCEYCELGVVLVDDKPAPDATIDHFQRRHGHHLVWVITFEHQTDITRYLNKRAYLPPTTAPGEALEPDAPILGPPRPEWRRISEDRRKDALRDRDGARLAGLRTEAERLAELLEMAREANVDVDSHLKVIRHRSNAIEQQIRDKRDRRAA
jgi:hypothetical protein